jgi:ribosomal protein S18 acetylase RimI-like enzyme
MRPADRERVEEISADIWDGHDYVPGIFDEWIQDPSATFQAAELDGVVVGFHRLRSVGPRALWYEGVRVASTHRRQGIARRMLESAIAEARSRGIEEIRLVTANPAAQALYESGGFELAITADMWRGRRLEGEEPPRMADPAQAEQLFKLAAADPSFAVYRGLHIEWDGAYDITADELARQAAAGNVRIAGGGRAMAILNWVRDWGFVGATFVSGSGAAFRDLMQGLRFEADAENLDFVRILLPSGHPATGDLEAVGYDSRTDPFRLFFYAFKF